MAKIVALLGLSGGVQFATAATTTATVTCDQDEPLWGEKQIQVSDCVGAGCQANGKDQNCAWCVYDLAKCSAAFDPKTCSEVYEARRAQGVTDCHNPPVSCGQDQPLWGEKQIDVPNCVGAGCRANGKDQNCAWCVYDFDKCSGAFDPKTCSEVYEARRAQGVTDCNNPPVSSQVSLSSPVATPTATEACDQDEPQWGEKQIQVSNCVGAGCRANGKDQNCAWCVYDLAKCSAAFDPKTCSEVYEARRAQGVTDCHNPPVSCGQDQPSWGEKQINVPNCVGAGCRANGKDQDCAWCVYNLTRCSAAFDPETCLQVNQAREAQGVTDCKSSTIQI